MIKRILLGLLALVLLIGVLGWVFLDRIAERAIETVANNILGADLRADLPDGLHILLCGTGSPAPDPSRKGPCNAVIAGDRLLIFDIGPGAVRNLFLSQIPFGDIEGVFLTHLHSDHMDGLGELKIATWLSEGRSAPLTVYGPEGVQTVVDGLNQAYSIDRGYRHAHQPDVVNLDAYGLTAETITLNGPNKVVLDDGDLRITAFKVEHSPVEPAFGYRIDYKGRSLVISGDTVFSPNVIAHSQDVDLLVHEALSADMFEILQRVAERKGETYMAEALSTLAGYHTTPTEAAQVAQQAGAQELVLSHISPGLPSRLFHGLFLGDARDHFDGKLTIAEDGMLISMPAGSDEIIHN